MKNIVFDLGGVLFARDKRKSTPEFTLFFDFIRTDPMPGFWVEYDRGTLSIDAVAEILCEMKNCPHEQCMRFLREAIDRQEPVAATERLVRDLKAAGYKLYVLSNMSREFIDFLRRVPVYSLFDGDVVSCEEGTVKPERRIYQILLERFALEPSETLFIDDRAANIAAAGELGIAGHRFDPHDPEGACDALRHRLLPVR